MEPKCTSRDEALKKFGDDISHTCSNCPYLKIDDGVVYCQLINDINNKESDGEFFYEN